MSSLERLETPSERLNRVILEYATRIGKSQDLDDLIHLNADFARDLSGADRCSLWLIDDATSELWTRVAHGQAPIRIPLGQGLASACILKNEVILINDLNSDERFLRRIDLTSGYCTQQVLCLPLRGEDRIIGALQLLNKEGGFTPVDAELLGLVAKLSATAIESERVRKQREDARLMRRELELALEVQSRLLPPSGEPVKGVQVVGFCRPAKTVGGDFYDVIPFSGGRCALTLGDVSGKSIPAAMMMASIQTVLRSLLQRDSSGLADVFSELNRLVHASSTSDRYSTLFCGIISADHSRLTYVNAGHVPPFLLRSDQTIVQLSEAGLPVGILPSVTYKQHEIALIKGDLLLIVSDGVIEASTAKGEFWETERLESFLRSQMAEPVSQLPQRLCAELDQWSAGAEQYDDITILAIQIGA